jgi:hypothetical protein
MRRVNIQATIVGEPSYATEAGAAETSDAAALVVRGGELTLVMPPGTPDAGVLATVSVLRGTLRLENDQVLTFEIHDGAVGAFFEHEATARHARRQEHGAVGLFTLTISAPP